MSVSTEFKKYKLSEMVDTSSTITNLKKQLDNQEYTCYICSDVIELGKEDIIRTPCNHIYHYDCMYYSFCQNATNPHKRTKINEIRQCPYCRTFVRSLLPRFKPYLYPPKNKVSVMGGTCIAVLKSGKRKGEKCNCFCKDNSLFCGRHRNSIEISEKEDEYFLITQ